MNSIRRERRGGGGFDDTDGYCSHLTDVATETLGGFRGGGHLFYESWGPEYKVSFQDCVIAPKNRSLKPGIDVEKVNALPSGHPAKRGYVGLDVLCAWIDMTGSRGLD